jgi:hypothetical protein
MGAISVGVFHQGTVFLLFHHGHRIPELTTWLGRVAGPGWNLAQTMPAFGQPGWPIPQFVNGMFWGGLWGIVIAAALRWSRWPDLLTGFLVGAIGCVGVAVTLVAALKGLPLFAGGNTQALARAALVNGAFGWGAALLMRPVEVRGFNPLPVRPAGAARL